MANPNPTNSPPRLPPDLAIAAVGLITAQGTVGDLFRDGKMSEPVHSGLAWSRPARGIDRTLVGRERLAVFVRTALADCLRERAPRPNTPLLLASCNGGAARGDAIAWRDAFDWSTALTGTPWQGQRLPVVSGACASGLQALHLASGMIAGGAEEVVVVAVDIDSPPVRENFETLRLLADDAIAPWQPGRTGFVLGEAAVAVRVIRTGADGPGAATPTRLSGPILANDLRPGVCPATDPFSGGDGLRRLLRRIDGATCGLIIGQGTGPAPTDSQELQAIAEAVGAPVPLTTAVHHFGHTLGASSLLSVALAALAARAALPRALALPLPRPSDQRLTLVTGAVASQETLVACRALGGGCGVCIIGGAPNRIAASGGDTEWLRPASPPALRHRLLRDLAHAATARRPARPPELLLVTMAAPLVPPADAMIGGRLLPSSILEMTPGFCAQLIAGVWGFGGPAICMVSPPGSEGAAADIMRRYQAGGDRVYHVDIQGMGKDRHVEWDH